MPVSSATASTPPVVRKASSAVEDNDPFSPRTDAAFVLSEMTTTTKKKKNPARQTEEEVQPKATPTAASARGNTETEPANAQCVSQPPLLPTPPTTRMMPLVGHSASKKAPMASTCYPQTRQTPYDPQQRNNNLQHHLLAYNNMMLPPISSAWMPHAGLSTMTKVPYPHMATTSAPCHLHPLAPLAPRPLLHQPLPLPLPLPALTVPRSVTAPLSVKKRQTPSTGSTGMTGEATAAAAGGGGLIVTPTPHKKKPRKDDDSTVYSRKNKSLGVLAHAFCCQYALEPPGTVIVLDGLAHHLRVERRRVYDVVNILEAIQLVKKQRKNTYHWMGKSHLPVHFAKLQQTAIQERPHTAMAHGLVVTAAPVQSSRPCNKKDKSLSRLTQQFLKLLLLGAPVISLHDASEEIQQQQQQSDSDVVPHSVQKAHQEDPSSNTKTNKIRRLYDIANVLVSIGILYKVDDNNAVMFPRKPYFGWAYELSPKDLQHLYPLTYGLNSSNDANIAQTPAYKSMPPPLMQQQQQQPTPLLAPLPVATSLSSLNRNDFTAAQGTPGGAGIRVPTKESRRRISL